MDDDSRSVDTKGVPLRILILAVPGGHPPLLDVISFKHPGLIPQMYLLDRTSGAAVYDNVFRHLIRPSPLAGRPPEDPKRRFVYNQDPRTQYRYIYFFACQSCGMIRVVSILARRQWILNFFFFVS